MFDIYDGRKEFYQWDKNRKLVVKDGTITQVHFANCLCPDAHVCEVYSFDDGFGGIRLVNVPDVLLTEYMDVRVWGYDGEMTKHTAIFEVVKRTKPQDYIYTEEERKTWEELEERVEALEQGGAEPTPPVSEWVQPEWGKGLVEGVVEKYPEYDDETGEVYIELTPEEYANIQAVYWYEGADTWTADSIENLNYNPETNRVTYTNGDEWYIELLGKVEGFKRIPSEYLGTLEQPVWGKGGKVESYQYADWNDNYGCYELKLSDEEWDSVIRFDSYSYGEECWVESSDVEWFKENYGDTIRYEYELRAVFMGSGIKKIPKAYLDIPTSGGGGGGVTTGYIKAWRDIYEDTIYVQDWSHAPEEVYKMIHNQEPIIFFVTLEDEVSYSIHLELPSYENIDGAVYVGDYMGNEDGSWAHSSTGWSLRKPAVEEGANAE